MRSEEHPAQKDLAYELLRLEEIEEKVGDAPADLPAKARGDESKTARPHADAARDERERHQNARD